MKNPKLIKKAVEWAKKKGFKKLKANCEDFEKPVQYQNASKDEVFVPDVTGVQRVGKSYIEVALKEDNIRKIVTKWKLLSTLANMKGGQFILLAPRGHKSFAEKIVQKYQLSAQVIYLKNE
jgi:hypothetical protein